MTKTNEKKPHIIYEWKLAPNNMHAEYYDVYARYSFGLWSSYYTPFSLLIGSTRGFETDRIYPLNHPKFCELNTRHFGCDTNVSTEEYLQRIAVFPLPKFVVDDVLEYLKQHAPKE